MKLIQGDCLEELKKLEDNSIDGCVTDPPSGIHFMGADWDSNKGGRDEWIKWMQEVFKEVQRVLKPGGHCIVWSIPKTSHWTGMSLELSGLEIRDCVYHIYGQGFPKSHNISKALDKHLGHTREVIGKQKLGGTAATLKGKANRTDWYDQGAGGSYTSEINITVPSSDMAKLYDGYGTQLKPAVECWWLCRKPIVGKNIVENVLLHGTGGLNIDKSRIEIKEGDKVSAGHRTCNIFEQTQTSGGNGSPDFYQHELGRFPSNLLHDGSLEIPEARFFYCSKPCKAERNLGCDELLEKPVEIQQPHNSKNLEERYNMTSKNNHPTIKPVKLMSYLIKLIMPPTGVVLDPFMGSGSTGISALLNGYDFIGIEQQQEYLDIAQARISKYEEYKRFLK